MARKTSKRKVTAVGIAEDRLHLLGRTTWEIDRTNFKLHETAAEPRGSTAPAGGSPQSLKAAEGRQNASSPESVPSCAKRWSKSGPDKPHESEAQPLKRF